MREVLSDCVKFVTAAVVRRQASSRHTQFVFKTQRHWDTLLRVLDMALQSDVVYDVVFNTEHIKGAFGVGWDMMPAQKRPSSRA